MAAINKPFLSGSQISSRTIATDTTTTVTSFGVSAKTKEVLIYTKVSSRTDGTFTGKLQGSVDDSTFIDLKAGTAISSNTQNFISWSTAVDGVLPPFLRLAVLSASTTSGATVEASIYIDNR